ncbi:putative bifunctional diguanylate cyclase/phosphodiesterase [Methylomagnum sp.]
MNEIPSMFAEHTVGLYILYGLALLVLPTVFLLVRRADAAARKRLEATVEQLQTSERCQGELAALARQEQDRLRALLSAMKVGILFEDRARRVEYVNPAFLSIWAIEKGFSPVGRHTHEVIEHSARRFVRPEHALGQVFNSEDMAEHLELDFRDGRIVTQTGHVVADVDGHPLGRMWLHEDVTHQRHTAEKLLYLAERDPLTGLYNRHRFQEHLERSISACLRNNGRFALIYFDLDEFKYINDTYGHKAGDTVLVRISGEVSALVRSADTFARLGGDEFAILCALADGDDPFVLPTRLIGAIGAIPFRFRGTSLRLTASVGIAIFPEHGDNAEDLVAHADTAMYQAKAQGKNTWSLYDPEGGVSEAMARRSSWNRRLTEALERDGFELHFQGVYEAEAKRLSHLEVLVRMVDSAAPDTVLMPDQFIHAAEKSGQITEIDRWVLTRSIERLGRSPVLPPLSVNISGRSFNDPSLPEFIRATLARHRVAPERLIVALTETAALANIQGAQRFIETTRRIGCRVCLDEFGSGFSTFAYLKYLGADIFKIDGLFVRDLPNNPDHQVFVKAMVDVASGLQKNLVATHVEDEPTLLLLRHLGVELVQGYHFDRPVADHPALTSS